MWLHSNISKHLERFDVIFSEWFFLFDLAGSISPLTNILLSRKIILCDLEFCGFWYDEHIQIFNTSEMFIELRFTGAFLLFSFLFIYLFFLWNINRQFNSVWFHLFYVISANNRFEWNVPFYILSALLTNNNCWYFFFEKSRPSSTKVGNVKNVCVGVYFFHSRITHHLIVTQWILCRWNGAIHGTNKLYVRVKKLR